MNNSLSLLSPIETLKLLIELLLFQLFKIYNCQTLPTWYISKKPIDDFNSSNPSSSLIGVLAYFSNNSPIFILATLSIENAWWLLVFKPFFIIPDFSPIVVKKLLHSLGKFEIPSFKITILYQIQKYFFLLIFYQLFQYFLIFKYYQQKLDRMVESLYKKYYFLFFIHHYLNIFYLYKLVLNKMIFMSFHHNY